MPSTTWSSSRRRLTACWRDAENDGQGRVACIATHPYVFGQPHNIRYLKEIFDYVRSDDLIWVTTAGEISDHFIDNFYDEQVSYEYKLLLWIGNAR